MAGTAADDLVREGRLDEAIDAVQELVRKQPAEATHRIYLFQLLAVRGRWERAWNQLQVLRDLSAGDLPLVHLYGPAIRAETLRAEIFAGARTPMIFGEPEPWIAPVIEALRLAAGGFPEEAARLREAAFEEATALPGTVDEKPFEWIADADPRLGPLLEVVIDGEYGWMPITRIRSVRFRSPQNLRDLVWAQGVFRWARGGAEIGGLVPVRYPGSETSSDASLAMSRKTAWEDPDSPACRGLGQRMWTTDQGEYAMLDVREIELVPPSDEGDARDIPGS